MTGVARLQALAIALALVVHGACFVLAADDSAAPLVYRRVFVPEEALAGQIRGLLPLKRDEFERRIQLAGIRVDALTRQAEARIDQATFRARLDNSQLRGGLAELVIVTTAKEPTLLSLDPCNVALESAAWQGTDRRSAILGADPAGGLRCFVEQSGTLELKWTQSAARADLSEVVFDLHLPTAPRRRLELMAPADIELTVDAGLIVSREPDAQDSRQRLWVIELGGQTHTQVAARRVGPSLTDRPLVVVREATSYTVLRSTVDLETKLTLDILRQPLHELALDAEPGVRVTTVRLGELPLPFSAVSGDDGRWHVAVDLPGELAGHDRAVEITATAQWPGEERWTLPRVKLVGGTFQEGRVEVNAPGWLRLHVRPLRGCVQSLASPAVAGRTADRFVFQTFEADAAIELAAESAAAPLREESGTQISIEPNQVTGVMVADIRSLGAGRFTVEAQIPRQWIVDAVETQPLDMLADRTLSARGTGPHQLHLKLAHPLTTQQPLRLILRAHYRRPANGQPLGEALFRLATFPEARDSRRMVAIRVNDPSAELRLKGEENLPRLDPAQLAESSLRLFESPPGTLLFEASAASDAVAGTLEGTTPRYRADVLIRGDVDREGIRQSVDIRCQPEASAVGSVVVRLAPRPRGAARWRLADDSELELPAVLESGPATASTTDAAVYRLMLPRPLTTALEIRGEWSSPLTSGGDISLAWLPEASRQTGQVEVHSADCSLLIRTSEVQPIPRPPAVDDRFTTLRGRYRYEAGRRARISAQPAGAGSEQQGAWIEMLHLESCFSPDGRGQHEATYSIRNAGLKEFRLRLPASVYDCRLTVGDRAEELVENIGADGEIVAALPDRQRTATVRLRYSTSGPALGAWPLGIVTAPVPESDLAVLSQTWRVGLPPGVTTIGVNRQPQSSAALDSVVSARLSWTSISHVLSGPALARRGVLAAPPANTSSAPAFPGWTMLRLNLPQGTEAKLMIYRPAVVRAWSLCLALVAVAGVCRWRLPLRWIALVAGVAAALAIANQPPLSWLASGGCVGLLVGGTMSLFWPGGIGRRLRAGGELPHTTVVLPAGPATSGTVLLIVLAATHSLVAQPSDKAESARPRVVFPIDGDQQPAGEYVFLEPEFYDTLHRLTDVRSSSFSPWLIERARYELPTQPTQPGNVAAVDELRAIFDVHTFQPATTLLLPLRREQVLLLEGRARLDGQPVTLAWQADGVALLVNVKSAGKHRLELALGAAARQTPDATILDLAVPPAATGIAVLPAAGPASGELISLVAGPEIVGAARVFPLVSTNRLSVRWPLTAAATSAALTLDADQLLWWRVSPGSVQLEARFRLRPLEGRLHEARIEFDPRLRLLPALASGPIGRVRVEEGSPNVAHVELSEPAVTEVQFRLSWLWPGASGTGTLLLPRVALRSDRLVRDWTAVSSEPGLEIDGSRAESSANPSAADFVQAWGDANQVPATVFHTASHDLSRAVAIHPTITKPSADQTIDWSVSGSAAQANITVHFADVPAARFEHRLTIPASLKVQRVLLLQSGRPAVVRWTQQSDGSVVVSLLEPPLADQTLTITAELPLAKNRQQFRLLPIGIEDATIRESQLRIYRQGDVQLLVQTPAGWTSQNEAELGQYRRGLGRLAAALVRGAKAGQTQPGITRQPNRPQLSGKLFLRADEADGDWRCETRLELQIAEGVLDELRLSIPEEMVGPLEIEPAMVQVLSASPGDARRQLTLRPHSALSGQVQVSLRCPLHSGATGVQAPDVELLGGGALERLVLLDRGSSVERIDWDTTGLLAAGAAAAASLPDSWRDAGGDLYRVITARFDATARIRQTTAAAPQVHLADIRADLLPGRRMAVTAGMTIHPAGARDAMFTLPPGCRLVQVMVDGVATPSTRQGLRSWHVAAPSELLPYRLTIVYDTFITADTSAEGIRLLAPQLRGVQVKQTLWTVRARDSGNDAAWEVAATSNNSTAQPLGAKHAALARLEAAARALDSVAAAQGTNLPASALAENYVRWRQVLNRDDRRLTDMLDQDDVGGAVTEGRKAALDEADKVGQKLVQAGFIDQIQVAAATTAPADDVQPATFQCITAGPLAELRVTFVAPPIPLYSSRAAVAWFVALAAVAFWLAGLSAVARDWLQAQAPFLTGLCGIAWWLLAPVGWLGWVLALFAVWLAVRSPWPRTSYEPGSTRQWFSSSRYA